MYNFPIGVLLQSFKLETYEAVKKAASIGAKGLQMHATFGPCAFNELVGGARRELLNFVKDNGLCFSALCGDFGKGFWRPELNPQLIEDSKRIMDMAREMETDVVTTHIGVVPDDPNNDRYKIMQEACFELAQYADNMGGHFAIETGPETAEVLVGFLDTLGSTGVAVNLDPANLMMVKRDDPVKAVHTLKKYIVHTHAKDGINLNPNCKAEEIYGITIRHDDWDGKPDFKEVPLGTGQVDFPAYLKALDEIGYKGFLTIERECGEDPAADIVMAADFLRDTIAKN